MAEFNHAYVRTHANEGGWTAGVGDRGGETYSGIARNSHPRWVGWKFIDQVANKVWNQKFPELNQMVKEFFKANYWDRYGFGGIHNQAAADLVYDFKVQSKYAVREIQETLNEMGYQPQLKEDNKFGSKTLGAINSVDPVTFVNRLVEKRVKYLGELVDSGYLRGDWLASIVGRVENYALEVAEEVGKNPSNTA